MEKVWTMVQFEATMVQVMKMVLVVFPPWKLGMRTNQMKVGMITPQTVLEEESVAPHIVVLQGWLLKQMLELAG